MVAGDHLVTLPGNHGSVSTNESNKPAPMGAFVSTRIDVQGGATFSSLAPSNMSRCLVTKAEMTGSPGTLAMLSGDSNVVVADASVFTAKDTTGRIADQWTR